MGLTGTTTHFRGRFSPDQPWKQATLKSRKKVLLATSIFLGVFIVFHYDFFAPKLKASDVSSSLLGERMAGSLGETGKPVRETSVADYDSVPNVSNTDNTAVVEDVSVMNGEAESASVYGQEKEAVKNAETAPVDEDITKGKPGMCLKHVLYDKPVKTGSTAISFAMKEFLKLQGEGDKGCAGYGPLSCVERAKSICNGTIEEKDHFSILGHLKFGGRELADCLRPSHYVVTSVREPYQRRKSAYLWNRTLNGSHFNIPHTVPFQEFMNRLPRCQLYHYYDGRGPTCGPDTSLEDRIEDIVARVDEVIDIYDEPVGPLHKLIAPYLRRENESIKLNESDYIEDFDRDTLKEEKMLYDRLRAKRLDTPNKDRLLCY